MTLQDTKKLAQHIFRLLKVDEIVIPIGRTNKGNLGIAFNKNSSDFQIMLDAVPLTTNDMLRDDNNIELKKMLEKYLFEQEPDGFEWSGQIEAQPGPKTKMHVIPMGSGEPYDVDEEGARIAPNQNEQKTNKKGKKVRK